MPQSHEGTHSHTQAVPSHPKILFKHFSLFARFPSCGSLSARSFASAAARSCSTRSRAAAASAAACCCSRSGFLLAPSKRTSTVVHGVVAGRADRLFLGSPRCRRPAGCHDSSPAGRLPGLLFLRWPVPMRAGGAKC